MISFIASLIALTAATGDVKPPVKTLYTVATAHLDTNWLWTIQDTIREHLPKTMDVNFEWFEKYPDYVFNFEGAFRYQLMKEYYPEQFAKLKEYVKKGRWKVTGSWVDAVDPNMPSPESLIRHTLYGNGYFKKEFGKTSVDVFLPDCFGFGYALPSIAVHSGLKGFSTQKLAWGSSIGIPFPVGVWKGVDGSEIVAALDPGSYGSSFKPGLASDPKLIKRVDTLGERSGAYVDFRYHGTGDTGGGPEEVSVKNLEDAIHAGGPLHVISAAGDQLFRDVTAEQMAKMPHYDGEMLLTTHGTGCYTSQAVMKKWNRENELLADSAERAAVMAERIGGAKYPREEFATIWTRFLWHQFHDDLTGTCIPQVYPFSWNDEVLCLNQSSQILEHSVAAVAAALDTRAKGVSVVVYNPLFLNREDPIVAEVDFSPSLPKYVRVFTGGKEVPSQVLPSDTPGRVRVAFDHPVTPVSVTAFDVQPSETPYLGTGGLSASETGLENQRYRLSINSDGDVSSVYDKQLGRELLKSPIRLQLRDDYSPDWPSWEIKPNVVEGEPREYVHGPATIRVVDNGPVVAAVEIERQAAGSTFTQRIQLSASDPNRIDFVNHIDWRTKGTLLKVGFSLAASNPSATYDLGLGTIQRPNNTPNKYEVVAQQWADLTNSDGSFGVTMMSNCKYGWDKPTDDTVRLTLLHTAKANRGYRFQETNDLGQHDFTFSIAAHSGDWRNGADANAARLNQPVYAFQTAAHSGNGTSLSFGSQADGVMVKAIKKTENSDEYVIRVFERTGRNQQVTLPLSGKVTKVREVNGAEDPVPGGQVTVDGGKLEFSLKPYQPRAFAITFADPKKISMPKSRPLTLAYDADVVGARNEASGGAFDADGHSIPAELLPKTAEVDNVKFNFGPGEAGKMNALSCRGQTLEIGNCTRVYVLAASGGDNVMATFAVGLREYEMLVPSFTGRIGQWWNRIVNGEVQSDRDKFSPPYIKRVPVGWQATHRHDKAGKDNLYTYCYLFKYAFDVPAGAHSIILPNKPSIKVMAVTAVDTKTPDLRAAGELYR